MSLFRGRESRLESDYIPETIEEWVLNIPTMLDARVAISMNDKDLADDALGIIIYNLGFSILIIQAKATTGGGWQSIIPPLTLSETRGGVPPLWIFTKSLLRRLLTWYRSSMTTDRLVKLERMTLHSKRLASISDNSVLNAFILSSPR